MSILFWERVMSSVTSSFPPQVTLAGTLNASNPSLLAAKTFADPNSGYPGGLRLASAIADNKAGHFNLASGITVASNALGTALSTLKDFQSSLTDLYSTVARLRDPAISDDLHKLAEQDFSNQLADLRDKLSKASVDNFNLIDASTSDGIKLDLQSGALTNVGKTPSPSASGIDQRFTISPNQITYASTDFTAALDSLSNVAVQTYPSGDSGNDNSLNAVNHFQDTIKQAADSLKTLQSDLTDAATQRLTVTNDNGAINASDAQQIATKLALALHNDSFNISSSATAHFFSLFA
jgi:hypothetical protein